MQTRIEIRQATESDAGDISRVTCDAIRNVNANDYPPAEIDRLLNNFTTDRVLDLMNKRITLVAKVDDCIVGTGSLQGAEIKSVFVSSSFRRKGIGSALMEELENAAIENDRIELLVSSSLSAVNFYSSLGYVEQRRKFFGDEETVQMFKSLC